MCLLVIFSLLSKVNLWWWEFFQDHSRTNPFAFRSIVLPDYTVAQVLIPMDSEIVVSQQIID